MIAGPPLSWTTATTSSHDADMDRLAEVTGIALDEASLRAALSGYPGDRQSRRYVGRADASQLAMSVTTAGSRCWAGSYSAGEDGPRPGKNRWLSAS